MRFSRTFLRIFSPFRVDFCVSRIPLNIFAGRELTTKRCIRGDRSRAQGLKVSVLYQCLSMTLKLPKGAIAYDRGLRESGTG